MVVPYEFSWRDSGLLPPIFQQGECGCCSSSVCLKSCTAEISITNDEQGGDPEPDDFAVQELINEVPLQYPDRCDPVDPAGCYGIPTKVNFLYVKEHQCAREADFPFRGGRTQDHIPENRPRLHIDDYWTLEEGRNRLGEAHFKRLRVLGGGRRVENAIRVHPIVGKAFFDNRFDTHGRGIYRTPDALEDVYVHSLLIIGYGITATGVEYFDCQNSWGPNWGDRGFCKVERSCFLKFCYQINPRVQGPGGN